MARYHAPDGRILTTCREHRTVGYAFVGGSMICRGCGQPASEHESFEDTLARKAREEAAV